MSLSCICPDDRTLRIYQHKCGPSPGAVRLPDRIIAVVNHRMFNFIPEDGLTDVIRFPFVLKFCRMHPDNNQFFGYFASNFLRSGIMCMQLMQQYVQKSRSTTLPFKSARVSGLETLSQAVPPVSSGAGILFFCADTRGIPPREKKANSRIKTTAA